MSNVIDAIINLVSRPIINVKSYYQGRNRANNAGDALEEYVKDLFAGTFENSESVRLEKIKKTFSYLGNSSNPPDIILKNGDAIEVKKIESNNAAVALNSSYPKQKLFRDSSMINKKCRECDGGTWLEKDMLYVVGVVGKNEELCHLCMVYGIDYCAGDEVYSKIKTAIKRGVESIEGIGFSESKELGHVNKVDPLGITYMRVRGMWGIDNPWKVFSYVYRRDVNKRFNFMSIISNDKWNTFDNVDSLINMAKNDSRLMIKDVEIKNPDNIYKLKSAKLIEFSF